MKNHHDKKRIAELKRRVRRLFPITTEEILQETELVNLPLRVLQSGDGSVRVTYEGRTIYMLRSDDYAPLVRTGELDGVLVKLRQLMVLDDLADI